MEWRGLQPPLATLLAKWYIRQDALLSAYSRIITELLQYILLQNLALIES